MKCNWFRSTLVAIGMFATLANAATPVTVFEYHNATLDHYFVTASQTEMYALESGRFAGWARTGKSFTALDLPTNATTPLCRFYMPPMFGDSHFYSASPGECDHVKQAFTGFVYESANVMHVGLPNPVSGACPPDWAPVYRLWNARVDSNHRYTTDRAIRDQMVTQGYVAEGYGIDAVAMCTVPQDFSPASPQVTLSASQTALVVPGAIALDATVSGTDVPIAQVYVYAGQTPIAAQSSPPYTFSYNSTEAADITFMAVAVDVNGVKGYSNPVFFSATATLPFSPPPPTVTPPPGTPSPPGTPPPPVTPPSPVTPPPVTPPGITPPSATILIAQADLDTFDFSSIATPSTNAAIVSYAWNFGDGATASGPTTTHRFTVSGNYLVELTVTDSKNATAKATKAVTAVAITPPPPPQPTPPAAGPPYLEMEMTDFASIQARGPAAEIPNPEFLVANTGMKYLRFGGIGPRLITWFPALNGSYDEAYFRYLLYIEPDVKVGMTELGVKLPGFAPYSTDPELSLRLEHQPNSAAPGAPGEFGLIEYYYNTETGNGYPPLVPLNATLKEGRWHCIEQHIKLNDIGVANGVSEIRVDGVRTFYRNNVTHRTNPAVHLTGVHVNVYHGGNNTASSPIHYRIAKIMVAPYWPGVPVNMPGYVPPPSAVPPITTGPFPAWRNGKPVGVVFPIANTSTMNGQAMLGNGNKAAGNLINAWNGLAASPTAWWSTASSGHDAGNGNGWENKVVKIDLAADVPQWQLVHPGSPLSAVTPTSHYADGLPAARHTYYTSHYLASLNRVMMFGVSAPYSIGFSAPAFQGGPQVDGFDVINKKWDPAGTFANIPAGDSNMPNALPQTAMSVSVHPITEDVYVSAKEVFAKWTRSTGLWSLLKLSPHNHMADSFEFHGAMIDASRNKWVHLHWSGKELTTINLTTLVVTRTPITGPYVADPSNEDYSTIVHDLDNDRYITLKGTKLYAIDPTTAASSIVASVPAPTNGTNNRLAYFKALGGIAYLPSYESNVLFMPTR